ncbi:MAG TPA: hypothetical protein IAB61_11965 [Candidatus Merdisoma merdipullorum]|nr:hypothetical protein [Candidatus Merdisoma merdipullorum]
MQKKKILSFGIFFLFLAVVFLVIPVTYAINDDTAMRDIASGAMSGTPDYHLVFVKAALGLMLQGLYTYLPGIDWYGCLWMGFILFSSVLVLWKLLSFCEQKRKNIAVATALFLMFFTLTMLWHLVNFQFTVVPAIVVGSAIFFYYTDESKGRKAYFAAALIILMIWISFCIRESVLFMAVPFGGLIILYKKDSVKKKAVMALIVCIGLAGIMGFEQATYSSEDWQTYREYNPARSQIYDYYGVPPYEENKEFYDQIGLSEYDVVNLERYNLIFVDELENGKMRQIAEYAEQKYLEETTLFERVKSAVRLVLRAELNRENIILNLTVKLLVLANLIMGFKRNRKSFWLNIGFLLCEGLICFYLGYEGRLPERVMAALLLIEFLSALGIFLQEYGNISREELSKYPKWVSRTAVVLLLALTVWRFAEVRSEQEQRFASNQEYELLKSYYQEHEENIYYIYVSWIAGYSENFSIWKEARISNGFSFGGWTTFLPVHDEGLRHFDIEDEDAALVEKDNVYLILNHPSDKINSHYAEEYGKVQWTEIDKAPVYGLEVPVYKITAEGE